MQDTEEIEYNDYLSKFESVEEREKALQSIKEVKILFDSPEYNDKTEIITLAENYKALSERPNRMLVSSEALKHLTPSMTGFSEAFAKLHSEALKNWQLMPSSTGIATGIGEALKNLELSRPTIGIIGSTLTLLQSSIPQNLIGNRLQGFSQFVKEIDWILLAETMRLYKEWENNFESDYNNFNDSLRCFLQKEGLILPADYKNFKRFYILYCEIILNLNIPQVMKRELCQHDFKMFHDYAELRFNLGLSPARAIVKLNSSINTISLPPATKKAEVKAKAGRPAGKKDERNLKIWNRYLVIMKPTNGKDVTHGEAIKHLADEFKGCFKPTDDIENIKHNIRTIIKPFKDNNTPKTDNNS